jgi:starch phosphorylase
MPSTAAQPLGDGSSWWERAHREERLLVAYFSPEFGVDPTLPVYSGGLGVLAGDHLKSAGDLGIPLVGVGLLYRRGYFRQDVVRGRQRERYPEVDPGQLGLTLERDGDGRPLVVEVELAEETVSLRIWRLDVRGTLLYLLDSDFEESSDSTREVTDVLYGGDREHRIRQELALGVGGSRALTVLGLEPSVFHLNEGHAAFLALERIRALVEERGLAFDEALELVRSSTVFTTHTPVAAGNERFDVSLARRYLRPLATGCGVEVEKLLELGSAPDDPSFGLTPLALRTAAYANGVSQVHGAVSRHLWQKLWADRATEEDVPIGHVTNAVHTPTWIAPEIHALLDDVGVMPSATPGEQHWERARGLEPAELWRVHTEAKERLLRIAAARRSGGRLGGESFDPAVLTVGFARRFATYKRAALLFSDSKRLLELLSNAERPIQLVFAGKAHPADEAGKEVLAEIVRVAGSRDAAGRIAFLPDYDMALAQSLVQGVDVWLNTPRPPHEASGTSGMKAALNGILNLSVLDGWWAEAFSPAIGWAISADVSSEGDAAEAAELVRLLEEEVAPAYYERGADGVPDRWVEMMRASIATVGAGFNGARMLADYVERYYLPAQHGGARRRQHAQALGMRER